MKINVWQAEALAATMREKDDPADESLKAAYAEIELARAGDGEQVLIIRWERGGYQALWHDGTDCTADYNPQYHPRVRLGHCPFCGHYGEGCTGTEQ